MKHWKQTVLLAGVLTLAACAPAPTEAPVAKTDPSVITSLREKYEAAENAGDPAAVLALWADDGILMPPNRPALEGKGAIEENYKQQFAMGKTSLKINGSEAVASADWAFERGAYSLKITGPDAAAAPLVEEEGKYIVIAKKQSDGSWKTSRLIFNSNAPAAPAPAMTSSAPPATAPAKKP